MNPSTQRQASLAFVLLLMVGCFHFLDFLPSPGLLDAVATKTKENNEVLITPPNSTDEKQSLIPKWISTYGKWHARQRRQFDRDGDEQVQFMVVVCLRKTLCGGVSDRIRSLPYWVVLAEQTDRVLLIHWNKKYALEDFWIPPQSGWDWTIPEAFLSRDPFRSSCLHQSNEIVREFHDHSNHEYLMNTLRGSERVVCVQTRNDLIPFVADNSYNNSSDYAIAQVFEQLFTPTDSLQEFINDNLHKMGMQRDQPFLAAHVRATYPLDSESGKVWPTWEEHSLLMKAWANNAVDQVILAYQQHFPNSKETMPPVYVASEVVQYLESNSSLSILALDDSLPRYHLDMHMANNSKVDMFPVFFDLWILSHSECVSYGIGSFGKLGARMAGLGCTIQHRRSMRWVDYHI